MALSNSFQEKVSLELLEDWVAALNFPLPVLFPLLLQCVSDPTDNLLDSAPATPETGIGKSHLAKKLTTGTLIPLCMLASNAVWELAHVLLAKHGMKYRDLGLDESAAPRPRQEKVKEREMHTDESDDSFVVPDDHVEYDSDYMDEEDVNISQRAELDSLGSESELRSSHGEGKGEAIGTGRSRGSPPKESPTVTCNNSSQGRGVFKASGKNGAITVPAHAKPKKRRRIQED